MIRKEAETADRLRNAGEGIAVVLGLGSVTSVGIIRCLAGYGILIAGLDASGKKEWGGASRHCLPIGFAPAGEQALLKALLFIGENAHELPVIFPASDEMVVFLETHRGALSSHFHLPCSKRYSLADLCDKSVVKGILGSHGIPTPASEVLPGSESLSSASVPFPFVLKPLNSLGYSKSDIFLVRNARDLEKAKKGIRYRPVLLEEFIPGPPSNMIEIMGYYSEKATTFHHIVIRKIRQYPLVTGSSSYIEIIENDKLSKVGLLIAQKLKITGLIDIEMKMSEKSKEYYFIEVNPRCGAPILISKYSGINLPYLYFEEIQGSSIMVSEYKLKSSYKWIKEYVDWMHLLNGKYPLFTYLYSLNNNVICSLFDINDIMPFFQMIKHSICLEKE
jgi:predicted ATP-grasp superfamily ATP-dependent carboligase